jgi:hypothetical protein
MTTNNAILEIVLGCALMVFAFVNKRFYASKGYGGATDKEVPRWAGRLLFAGGGTLFIIAGVTHLLLDL